MTNIMRCDVSTYKLCIDIEYIHVCIRWHMTDDHQFVFIGYMYILICSLSKYYFYFEYHY